MLVGGWSDAGAMLGITCHCGCKLFLDCSGERDPGIVRTALAGGSGTLRDQPAEHGASGAVQLRSVLAANRCGRRAAGSNGDHSSPASALAEPEAGLLRAEHRDHG